MQNRTMKLGQLSLGVLFSIGLVACGGGSSDESAGETNSEGSSSDSTSSDNNSNTSGSETNPGTGAGTGGCVSFPRPIVGQKVKFEFKNQDQELVFTTERTVTAISDTSITEEVSSQTAGLGDIDIPDVVDIPDDIDIPDLGLPLSESSTYIETFTIANNYRDITSSTTTTLGQTTTTSYAPYQRVPVDKVCEGQTWSTTFTETSLSEGVVQHSQNYTVEAVNVSKTSTAGTFNTFRVHSVQDDTEGYSWIDIATGVAIFSEYKDVGDTDDPGTIDLIEMN